MGTGGSIRFFLRSIYSRLYLVPPCVLERCQVECLAKRPVLLSRYIRILLTSYRASVTYRPRAIVLVLGLLTG